jgi:hypothetical protein
LLLTIIFYNSDIQVLKTYGAAPYTARLKGVEKELKELQQKINEKIGMATLQKYHLAIANTAQVSRYFVHARHPMSTTAFNSLDRNQTQV